MERENSFKFGNGGGALAQRLAIGSTAFEAAPLIKPPALRGVSDFSVSYRINLRGITIPIEPPAVVMDE